MSDEANLPKPRAITWPENLVWPSGDPDLEISPRNTYTEIQLNVTTDDNGEKQVNVVNIVEVKDGTDVTEQSGHSDPKPV